MEENSLESGEQPLPRPRPLSYAEMVASFVPEKKPDIEELPKQTFNKSNTLPRPQRRGSNNAPRGGPARQRTYSGPHQKDQDSARPTRGGFQNFRGSGSHRGGGRRGDFSIEQEQPVQFQGGIRRDNPQFHTFPKSRQRQPPDPSKYEGPKPPPKTSGPLGPSQRRILNRRQQLHNQQNIEIKTSESSEKSDAFEPAQKEIVTFDHIEPRSTSSLPRSYATTLSTGLKNLLDQQEQNQKLRSQALKSQSHSHLYSHHPIITLENPELKGPPPLIPGLLFKRPSESKNLKKNRLSGEFDNVDVVENDEGQERSQTLRRRNSRKKKIVPKRSKSTGDGDRVQITDQQILSLEDQQQEKKSTDTSMKRRNSKKKRNPRSQSVSDESKGDLENISKPVEPENLEITPLKRRRSKKKQVPNEPPRSKSLTGERKVEGMESEDSKAQVSKQTPSAEGHKTRPASTKPEKQAKNPESQPIGSNESKKVEDSPKSKDLETQEVTPLKRRKSKKKLGPNEPRPDSLAGNRESEETKVTVKSEEVKPESEEPKVQVSKKTQKLEVQKSKPVLPKSEEKDVKPESETSRSTESSKVVDENPNPQGLSVPEITPLKRRKSKKKQAPNEPEKSDFSKLSNQTIATFNVEIVPKNVSEESKVEEHFQVHLTEEGLETVEKEPSPVELIPTKPSEEGASSSIIMETCCQIVAPVVFSTWTSMIDTQEPEDLKAATLETETSQLDSFTTSNLQIVECEVLYEKEKSKGADISESPPKANPTEGSTFERRVEQQNEDECSENIAKDNLIETEEDFMIAVTSVEHKTNISELPTEDNVDSACADLGQAGLETEVKEVLKVEDPDDQMVTTFIATVDEIEPVTGLETVEINKTLESNEKDITLDGPNVSSDNDFCVITKEEFEEEKCQGVDEKVKNGSLLNAKREEVQGTSKGESDQVKPAQIASSISSFDESQGVNTGEEDSYWRIRERVKKKRRKPKQAVREGSTESESELATEAHLGLSVKIAPQIHSPIPENMTSSKSSDVDHPGQAEGEKGQLSGTREEADDEAAQVADVEDNVSVGKITTEGLESDNDDFVTLELTDEVSDDKCPKQTWAFVAAVPPVRQESSDDTFVHVKDVVLAEKVPIVVMADGEEKDRPKQTPANDESGFQVVAPRRGKRHSFRLSESEPQAPPTKDDTKKEGSEPEEESLHQPSSPKIARILDKLSDIMASNTLKIEEAVKKTLEDAEELAKSIDPLKKEDSSEDGDSCAIEPFMNDSEKEGTPKSGVTDDDESCPIEPFMNDSEKEGTPKSGVMEDDDSCPIEPFMNDSDEAEISKDIEEIAVKIQEIIEENKPEKLQSAKTSDEFIHPVTSEDQKNTKLQTESLHSSKCQLVAVDQGAVEESDDDSCAIEPFMNDSDEEKTPKPLKSEYDSHPIKPVLNEEDFEKVIVEVTSQVEKQTDIKEDESDDDSCPIEPFMNDSDKEGTPNSGANDDDDSCPIEPFMNDSDEEKPEEKAQKEDPFKIQELVEENQPGQVLRRSLSGKSSEEDSCPIEPFINDSDEETNEVKAESIPLLDHHLASEQVKEEDSDNDSCPIEPFMNDSEDEIEAKEVEDKGTKSVEEIKVEVQIVSKIPVPSVTDNPVESDDEDSCPIEPFMNDSDEEEAQEKPHEDIKSWAKVASCPAQITSEKSETKSTDIHFSTVEAQVVVVEDEIESKIETDSDGFQAVSSKKVRNRTRTTSLKSTEEPSVTLNEESINLERKLTLACSDIDLTHPDPQEPKTRIEPSALTHVEVSPKSLTENKADVSNVQLDVVPSEEISQDPQADNNVACSIIDLTKVEANTEENKPETPTYAQVSSKPPAQVTLPDKQLTTENKLDALTIPVVVLASGEKPEEAPPSLETDDFKVVTSKKDRQRNRTISSTDAQVKAKESGNDEDPIKIDQQVLTVTTNQPQTVPDKKPAKGDDEISSNFQIKASKSLSVHVAEENKPPDPITREKFWTNKLECENAERMWHMSKVATQPIKADVKEENDDNDKHGDSTKKDPKAQHPHKNFEEAFDDTSYSKEGDDSVDKSEEGPWSDESTYLRCAKNQSLSLSGQSNGYDSGYNSLKRGSSSLEELSDDEDMSVKQALFEQLESRITAVEKTLESSKTLETSLQVSLAKMLSEYLTKLDTNLEKLLTARVLDSSRLTRLKVLLCDQIHKTEDLLRGSTEKWFQRQQQVQNYKAFLGELETWIFETQTMFTAKLLLLRNLPNDNLMKEMLDEEFKVTQSKIVNFESECQKAAKFSEVSTKAAKLLQHLNLIKTIVYS